MKILGRRGPRITPKSGWIKVDQGGSNHIKLDKAKVLLNSAVQALKPVAEDVRLVEAEWCKTIQISPE